MINKPKTYRFGLQYLLFLVSIVGTTGMNMSVENNMLHVFGHRVIKYTRKMEKSANGLALQKM